MRLSLKTLMKAENQKLKLGYLYNDSVMTQCTHRDGHAGLAPRSMKMVISGCIMLPGSRPDLESAWRFLKDGHLELDSNRSERSIRPHVLMIGA